MQRQFGRFSVWAGRLPIWKKIISILFVVLLVPYLVIPFYALPFVHPVSTLMMRDSLLRQGYDRQWVDFENISPILVRSVMASEDGQFCYHHGVDWRELLDLLDQTLHGEATRGGSTIPMQVSKNLFLWESRSFVRKVLELPLAVTSSFVWSKQRMIEIYLNVAHWGPNIYGIEAASQHYFKVPASRLSRRQAALLAVSLPNPIERVANKPSRGLSQLASIIERRARSFDSHMKCLYR